MTFSRDRADPSSGSVALGSGPAGILTDLNGSPVLAAVSGGNTVAIVDLQSLTVTGEMAPSREPDGMAWAVQT